MKKTNIILLLLMVLACLAACHKDKEMDVKEAVVSNEEMTVSGTQVCFSWQVDFAGQFQTGVEVSQSENMADLRRVEASKEEDKFVAVVDSLTEGKKYYYRIVVWNKFGSYEETVKDFTTAKTFSIHVDASEGGTAVGGGTFAEGDTCTVIASANVGYNFVNWTENGNQVSAEAEYSFAVTGNRSLVANFTSQEYTITATAEPEEGGAVDGFGGYNNGDECTLTATANEGFEFLNWTKEDGTIVSTDPVYAFTVTETAAFVAHFQAIIYTISASAYPENSGTISGGGTYQQNQSCTVTATANNGYTFVNWTENGNVVSTNASYTFTVNGNRTLVAIFTYNGGGSVPEGAINGLFTINANGDQVYFSQGNLQYIGSASTPYWKFADNQWDCLGISTEQNTSSRIVDRDLFGWGTSGWNCGNSYFQPWDIIDLDGYGPPGNYDLIGNYVNSDWGMYNPIVNGGNMIGLWRTLTKSEWNYVFKQRNTLSGIRFAKVLINDVPGVLLLPDDWSGSYVLNGTDDDEASFNSNIISLSDWVDYFQENGAVFLPTGGYRKRVDVYYHLSGGYYWSADASGTATGAYYLFFANDKLETGNAVKRYYGFSIRLVFPAQ